MQRWEKGFFFLCLTCLNKRALQQTVHFSTGLSYDTWTTHTNPLAYTHSCTCQAVRQEVHMRWPQGSIFTSLSFSAQILQSWKVEPISQYSSYCSCGEKKNKKTWQDGNITQEQQHLRSFWKKKKKKGEEKKKSLEGSRAIGSCGGVVWVSVQWLQNESVHCTYKILRTCMSLKRSSTVFKTKLWIKMLIILKIL